MQPWYYYLIYFVITVTIISAIRRCMLGCNQYKTEPVEVEQQSRSIRVHVIQPTAEPYISPHFYDVDDIRYSEMPPPRLEPSAPYFYSPPADLPPPRYEDVVRTPNDSHAKY